MILAFALMGGLVYWLAVTAEPTEPVVIEEDEPEDVFMGTVLGGSLTNSFKTVLKDPARLPRAIGASRAKELIFTGKMITAAEAVQIGLANKTAPADALMEEVLKTAKDIAAKGRVSLRAVKQAINQGLNVDLVSGCNIEVDAFALTLASADAKEGTTAFLEKRKAVFKGTLTD